MSEALGGSLVGYYFHVLDREGQMARQGHFISDLGHGYFLVEYFEGIADQTPLPGRRVGHIAAVADDTDSVSGSVATRLTRASGQNGMIGVGPA